MNLYNINRMDIMPPDMGETEKPVFSRFPQNTPIGMAYVPYQEWETPYPENVAFSRGTIFPRLDLPFIGEEAVPNGR